MNDLYLVLWQYLYLLKEITPYFLFGVVFAAAIATFVKPEWGYKFLHGNILPVFVVSFIAAVLPGCSCATMPMAEGIKRKGVNTGTLVAFIMMSPLLAPHTIFLTYGMLGWKFAFLRVMASFIFIPILGIILNLCTNPPGKYNELSLSHHNKNHNNNNCCPKNTCNNTAKSKSFLFLQHFKEISLNLSKYFLLGLGIAAIFSVIVPEGAIASYIGSSGTLSYLLAALIGVPIYVCEGEEIPIALSLLNKGLGAGPTFTFLLASVGTCIPTILMAKKMLGYKITLVYVISWFIFVIISGFAFGTIV